MILYQFHWSKDESTFFRFRNGSTTGVRALRIWIFVNSSEINIFRCVFICFRMAESEAAASESTSSRGAIGAEPEKSHREGTYAESLKIQRAFLDQNCNTYDEESPFPLRTDLDGEEDAAGNWGTWSPETEKYWTLQYSDAKRVLEVLADEEVDAPVECQRPSNADTLFLIIDEDGADKEIRKKFPGEHGTGPYKPPLPPPQPPNKNRVLRQVSFWVRLVNNINSKSYVFCQGLVLCRLWVWFAGLLKISAGSCSRIRRSGSQSTLHCQSSLAQGCSTPPHLWSHLEHAPLTKTPILASDGHFSNLDCYVSHVGGLIDLTYLDSNLQSS